jgi:ubiquitin-conjugating enzyme E2 variant
MISARGDFTMTILFAWLLADFISGLVHWWEDRAIVGASQFEFINGVRADNERHHTEPRYFLTLTWWENINTTAPIAWALTAALVFIGAPAVITLAAFFLSFGNLVHRFAHEGKQNRPKIVSLLQYIGLLQSPSHHAGHHFKRGKLVMREDSRIRYCVMSSWLNPILDKIKFFHVLERILKI